LSRISQYNPKTFSDRGNYHTREYQEIPTPFENHPKIASGYRKSDFGSVNQANLEIFHTALEDKVQVKRWGTMGFFQ